MIRSDQGGREEKGSFRSAEEESFQNGVHLNHRFEPAAGEEYGAFVGWVLSFHPYVADYHSVVRNAILYSKGL